MKNKILIALASFVVSLSAFAQTPNDITTDQLNASGVGYTRRFYPTPTDGLDRLQYFNATTLRPGYLKLGSGLAVSGGDTLTASGAVGPAGPKGDTGNTGAAGPSNVLSIGSVSTGSSSSATITGASPSQVLNLVLQKGDQGAQGVKGDPGNTGSTGATGGAGPANTLAIGTVTSGVSPSATITGTSPNQTLNLVLQKGDTGATGSAGTNGTNGTNGAAGPANTLTIGTVTQGTTAATITGTSPNQVLNLVLQKGDTGSQGPQGNPGATGATGSTGAPGTTSITQPTTRTLSLSTSYQATDTTKVAVLTVGATCTNATTVLASSACTLTPRIGTGTLTCSTGTAMPALSVTVQLGLVFTSTQATPYVLEIPAGASFILCPTAGTWTLDIREQLRG